MFFNPSTKTTQKNYAIEIVRSVIEMMFDQAW